jgi:hypothetical protein
MRDAILRVSVGLVLLIGTCGIAVVQAQPQNAKPAAGGFDPHDLGGVWVPRGRGPAPGAAPGAPPPPPPAAAPAAPGAPGARGPVQGPPSGLDERLKPAFTPWGQMKFDSNIPTVGPRVQPGKENDPTLWCDPDGFPKILSSPEPWEIVLTPKRMFMFFEKDHLWREIWLDGRQLSQDPDPTWNGTSTASWEGNVLVVKSNGFNDGTWLDYAGDPHSDQMTLEERYERVDKSTLSVTVTVTDPKAYTAPWKGAPKFYNLEPDWEIHEWYCTQDDSKSYDDQIRLKAPSGK